MGRSAVGEDVGFPELQAGRRIDVHLRCESQREYVSTARMQHDGQVASDDFGCACALRNIREYRLVYSVSCPPFVAPSSVMSSRHALYTRRRATTELRSPRTG
jgi:hypothetical protein